MNISESTANHSLELVKMNVNGRDYVFKVGVDFAPSDTLSTVLRERLGLMGVRVSCEQGACGACTVLYNDEAVLSCMKLAVDADGAKIVTIEGLSSDDPVVKAFIEESEPGYGTAMQCGFCTPGFVMGTHSLLKKNPNPTLEEVKEGLSGHFCRCGCYKAISKAALVAAGRMLQEKGGK